MEGREVMNSSGVTVVGSDAPSDYHVAPRTGNPTGSAPPTTNQLGFTPPGSAAAVLTGKKKRGRPRKYGPDGPVAAAVSKPLSPKPISTAAPSSAVIDFSGEDREKLRPSMTAMKRQQLQQQKLERENSGQGENGKSFFEEPGDWVSCSVGASFTPHLINVNIGEDVTMKVISFSQQGPRAICILSANGVISSVTLRQPDSSGGTLTYEGRFEILSLTGSFVAAETGGIRNRSGGMSVSLASPDGRVIGGGVAGSLVAAGPVQIVVGSFLTGNQHQQYPPKKQKTETVTDATPTAAVRTPAAAAMEENHHGGGGGGGGYPKPTNISSSSPFRGDNWSSYQPDPRTRATDINVPLPG